MEFLKRVASSLLLENRKTRNWLGTLSVIAIVGTLWVGRYSESVDPLTAISIASVLTVVLLLLLLRAVVGLTRPGDVHVFGNEEAARDRQEKIIDAIHATTRHPVRMLEYSTKTSLGLIKKMTETSRVEALQLLICHPLAGLNQYQQKRIRDQITELSKVFTDDVLGRMSVEIKCYRQRASMRGRDYGGGFVALGTYTYDSRKGERRRPNGHPPIWGDRNAIIVADARSHDGDRLLKDFDRVFSNLWRDATWLQAACLELTDEQQALYDKDWLKTVSPDDPGDGQ